MMGEKCFNINVEMEFETQDAAEIGEEITEMIDCESAETLKDIKKMILYYYSTMENKSSVHKSLATILHGEKNSDD